jgi:hypothetical protein
LPNSEGWNWKGPISNHRFEPRVASASGKTSSIPTSVTAKIVLWARR